MAEEEESDTNSTIMTISELIENAFGDPEVNVVHHKHLQAVLYIIARQLRILERRVAVNLKPYQVRPPKVTLSVTEVKLQALSDMKQKALGKSTQTTAAHRTKQDSKEKGKKVKTSEGYSEKSTSVSDETSTDKGSSSKKSGKKTTAFDDTPTVVKTSAAGKNRPQDYTSDDDGASSAGKSSRAAKSTADKSSTPDELSSAGQKSSASKKFATGRKTDGSKSSAADKTSLDDEISDDDTTSTAYKRSKSEKKSTDSKKPTDGKSSAAGQMSLEDNISDDTASLTDKTGKKTTTGKVRTADEISLSDKMSSMGRKTAVGKKTETSVSGKTSTMDETSDDDTESAADRTSKAEKKSTAGKIKKSGISSTAEKSVSDNYISNDDTMSTADKISKTDKKTTAGEKSSAAKALTSGKPSAADKSVPEDDMSDADEASTTDKSSRAEKKMTSGKKTAAGKSLDFDKSAPEDTLDVDTAPAGKTSKSEKTTNSKKTTNGKTSSEDRPSLSRILSDKLSADKSGKPLVTQGGKASGKATSKSADPQNYLRLLNEVEETRERELRVIHQRADSREERETTPTPLASLDSFEATYEKLLVVERISPEEAKARAAAEKSFKRVSTAPRLSVVTQEQFQELVSAVRQIKKKFAPVGSSDFPENLQLMDELRKGASLTDAMAALQLSARLEATEKALKNMLSLVTDLASQTPGFQPSRGGTDKIELLFGASDGAGRQGKGGQKTAAKSSGKSRKDTDDDEFVVLPSFSQSLMPATPLVSSAGGPDDDEPRNIEDMITFDQLEIALQSVYDNIIAEVTDKSKSTAAGAEAAMKLVINLEKKIDSSINLGNKMENLEHLVSKYADQINYLDTGFSSQLTNFQEELTQMQHNLEIGLETMAEVLANTGGDATAVSELNEHFNDLQLDINEAMRIQTELKNIQSLLNMDLDGLRIQIEMLRDTKSDRDEVADALRDKAGLKDLNGLISQDQFDAVCGDIEKRISAAYDKFNNQESIWQRAIDELVRELNEKADIIQVESLRDEINRYLEDHRKKLKFITDIVGEPSAAAILKHLNRDAACLSCSTPAHMKATENTTPVLPAMRPPTIGAEAQKPTEDHGHGDHGSCYQGYPVKHPIDPRAHICKRWCGGSHTLINNTQKTRIPPSVTITSLNRNVGQERGTDGKMYAVDEQVSKKPCTQCNIPVPPATSDNEIIPLNDSPSFDYHPMLGISDYDVTCCDNPPLPCDPCTTDYDVTPPL